MVLVLEKFSPSFLLYTLSNKTSHHIIFIAEMFSFKNNNNDVLLKENY